VKWSYFWVGGSRSVDGKIPCTRWTPLWATWLHSTFHSLRPYFCKIHLNIILTSTPRHSSIPNVSSLQVSEKFCIHFLIVMKSHISSTHFLQTDNMYLVKSNIDDVPSEKGHRACKYYLSPSSPHHDDMEV